VGQFGVAIGVAMGAIVMMMVISMGFSLYQMRILNHAIEKIVFVTDRHIGATLRSAYRSQSMIAVMEPVRDRHIGASARSP